jgi:hypothetical protein
MTAIIRHGRSGAVVSGFWMLSPGKGAAATDCCVVGREGHAPHQPGVYRPAEQAQKPTARTTADATAWGPKGARAPPRRPARESRAGNSGRREESEGGGRNTRPQPAQVRHSPRLTPVGGSRDLGTCGANEKALLPKRRHGGLYGRARG